MEKRRTVIRWFSYNAGIWVVVVLACVAYITILHGRHPPGYAWVVPPVAALLGTGLPMQLSVMRIARTALS